jgi:hypothetical protein
MDSHKLINHGFIISTFALNRFIKNKLKTLPEIPVVVKKVEVRNIFCSCNVHYANTWICTHPHYTVYAG